MYLYNLEVVLRYSNFELKNQQKYVKAFATANARMAVQIDAAVKYWSQGEFDNSI